MLGTVFCATSLANAEGTTNTMYDDVTVEVVSACSIGATNNEHTGTIESGNLTTIGNDSTFNITCNDADGYIVYVVGNTNDVEGNTDLIGTKNNNKITTGTNTSGDTSNWFFKLSNPSGLTINSGLDENSLIPSTRTNAVSRASGVSNPEGDTFTASYSAYISSLQPADTYTGKVKYLLFHPSTSDSEGNTPKPVTELLTSVYTASTDNVKFVAGDNIEVLIVADNSSKQKPYYAFPGTDVSFTGASGKVYIITVVPKAGNVLDGPVLETKSGDEATITAKGKSGSYASMQDFNSCTEAGTNVTDVRNNISYTVAKIGNKCYMLSNLRLAAGTTLTSATSAVSSNFTLPDKSVSDAWTSSSQNWYGKASMKECHGIAGNGSTNSKCAEAGNNITEYYYNWYAAKANPSNPSNPTSSSSASSTNDNASLGSICPKNWSLPPDQDSDINTTNTRAAYLGANRARFMTSGYFYSGSQSSVGSRGYWWSSTRYTDGNAYLLNLYSGGVNRGSSLNYNGSSVRCMR